MFPIHSICVFASSSPDVDLHYSDTARELGTRMASEGIELIYGGGKYGLMGIMAEAVHASGGKISGIIPQSIYQYGVAYEHADTLLITKDLRERKAEMERRADAFAALPGGFGTLEELLEFITLKQLGYHHKPIVILNIRNFYDPLAHLFNQLYEQRFAHPDFHRLFYFAGSVDDMFTYLKNYELLSLPRKLNG